MIKDKSAAAKRLYYAEQNMDQAAIFTIHSFCQRLLTTYAFEAGSLFNKTLLKDEKHLILQQVQNFWREYFGKIGLIRKHYWMIFTLIYIVNYQKMFIYHHSL